jgi:hypothetical protein
VEAWLLRELDVLAGNALRGVRAPGSCGLDFQPVVTMRKSSSTRVNYRSPMIAVICCSAVAQDRSMGVLFLDC